MRQLEYIVRTALVLGHDAVGGDFARLSDLGFHQGQFGQRRRGAPTRHGYELFDHLVREATGNLAVLVIFGMGQGNAVDLLRWKIEIEADPLGFLVDRIIAP